MSTGCSWDLGFKKRLMFFPITPQVFALTRITHNNVSTRMSCILQSRAFAPNNARVKRPKPQKTGGVDYGEKKAHRGRIDWLPGKCVALPQICFNAHRASSVTVMFWCFPHAISLRNVIPGSLLPLFRTDRTNRPAFTFLTKRYNVVLSVRITLCTIAVGTKSFPAPASNVECS